ncbi:hypothetical protein CPC08DRAFT_705518 [Agrocybe pediades]|nr:hypothetical protein CPC08DRAFT_705518 [Agrocybe pediades]
MSTVTGLAEGYAIPFPSSVHSSRTLHPRDPTECTCPDTRTIIDIVWNCLATIFLCTWVSIHPNLPPPADGKIRGAWRRVVLMLWALLAPEMIIMWSFRQWFYARRLTKMYKDRNWSMVHSFLLIMGGFALHRGEENLGTVTYSTFIQLEKEEQIDFPAIGSEEIEDKSKGDGLSKLIVIMQTGWFIIQVIARGAQKLAITELEVATMALCSLNAMMYFFWWYKPLNVKCRIPVYLKPTSDYVFVSKLKNARVIDDPEHYEKVIARALDQDEQGQPSKNALHTLASRFNDVKHAIQRRLMFSERTDFYRFFSDLKRNLRNDYEQRNIVIFIPLSIFRIVTFIVIQFAFVLLFTVIVPAGWIMLGIGKNSNFWREREGMTHLPAFYSPQSENRAESSREGSIAFLVFSLSAIMFGGLHCIAWHFNFPTHAESVIWRVLSLYITTIPVSALLCAALQALLSLGGKATEDLSIWVFAGTFSLVTGLYLPVRMVLLVESFITLRALPANAFLNVDWNNFIPHL